MGSKLSRLVRGVLARNERRLLLVGLDNAGKTTVMYRMHVGKPVTTVPTVGFNIETVKYKKLTLNLWDVGGQDRLRPHWRHHYTGTQGVIYVIDSCDRERMDLAASELHTMLADDQLASIALLVLANKQDQDKAMSTEEIAKRLDLVTHCGDRPFKVQGCVATTGDGIAEGIEFLCTHMKKV